MNKPDNHIDELDEILHDLAEALESLDNEPDSGKWAENGIEYIDEAKHQILELIKQARIEEGDIIVTTLQDRANSVAPNLLLNEAVNIKWERLSQLKKEDK